VYGQIAGAYYGEDGIPAEWRSRLAFRQMIESFAEMLFELSRINDTL
jgi:ADP-ribosylglycohydrolase